MSLFQPEKRMLKVGLMAAAAAVLALTYLAMSGSPKEPADFRGIKWGSNIGSLPDMKLLAEDGAHKFYEKANDRKKVGEVNVDQIVYGFHKDRFYTVMIYFSSPADFARVRDTLSSVFGNPVQVNETEKKLFWNGERVNLLLNFDDAANAGRLIYLFKPIQLEVEVGG
jgi:hypothetical protein